MGVHENANDDRPLVDEDVLDAHDIQGNSLAGFRKDYQRLLFFSMDRTAGGVAAMREWLRAIAPQVSSLAEVYAFNRLFRLLRRRTGRDPEGVAATWLNVAFSASAVRTLTTPEEAGRFTDGAFQAGMADSAILLSDPIDGNGNPIGWKVGGRGNEADVLVIVASDDPAALSDRVAAIDASIQRAGRDHGVAPLNLIWDQAGNVLPPPLKGHEHFGFKDGIAQPGVRGYVRSSLREYLTPRLIDAHVIQNDPTRPEFSQPGRPLVWPGQFVFGYSRQDPNDTLRPVPETADTKPDGPPWAKNGSYVVVRRLRQNVPAFRAFIDAEARRLQQLRPFSDMTPTLVASKLVGRWPSGAPLMRSALSDDPALATDNFANNAFDYVMNSPPPLPLDPAIGYAGDTFPVSRSDTLGIACPLSAHVRKVNPRDTTTEQGNSTDVLTRLVLRRGIPFGEPYDLANPATRDDPEYDRGLLFVSYQRSIDRQFVFLQKNWANDGIDPNGGGGQDGIIGQRGEQEQRVRTVDIVAPNGTKDVLNLLKEWVVPTGGGFFFSPSISAIIGVLAREP